VGTQTKVDVGVQIAVEIDLLGLWEGLGVHRCGNLWV
jgi:hypothetical protein